MKLSQMLTVDKDVEITVWENALIQKPQKNTTHDQHVRSGLKVPQDFMPVFGKERKEK